MDSESRVIEFEKEVKNRFEVYNRLFLSLPFQQIRKIGELIPLMQEFCQRGLDAGREPLDILDSFFGRHTDIESEEDKIDFMFRIIQYVERQIVLFDSVEDAAFPALLEEGEQLSMKEYIRELDAKSGRSARASDFLASFGVRIVFTAHPTQFYPPSVLKIIEKLRHYISDSDNSGVELTLRQLGMTSLIKSKSPTPFEEAQNIIYFLRNVYYDAVGELYGEIRRHVGDDGFANPNLLRLGFWPGGDRDGNPFVTSETTNNVADELRMALMKCYYGDVKDLEQKLTFGAVEGPITLLREALYSAMFDPKKRLQYAEIIDPLARVRKSLVREYGSLYLEDLDALIDKVRIFRTHFASLDIRQNHSVHRRIVTDILIGEGLIKTNLDELSRETLISVLLRTDLQINEDALKDDLVQDTIRTIRQIKQIQERNGEDGCNRYIISNSEDIFSVLFVFGLFRWCWGHDLIPIDIIPLFESMDSMTGAGSIMKELFEIAEYRSHVRSRSGTQTMMLGFSDGTKDGGYLRANWSIHKTKEALTAVCESSGIKAVFFDGRGGPPARGGGKTHRFYASQGEDIANHSIELTIQGQMITSKYGTKAHFKHNCEQLIAAGMHNHVFECENNISGASRELLDELARLSYEKYTALKNHPQFIPYLENKSTLRFYSRVKIGSRPQRRGGDEKLNLEDLRAIPFVGSWSQLKQNVPGYYGVGSALESLVKNGRLSELQSLFRDVPFFKTLMLNSMMSLTKCRFELTAYMAEDSIYGSFWRMLHGEYERSREMLLLVSGYDELMEEEPVSRSSISIREDIVVALLVIQQYALQKLEQNSDRKAVYEKIVTRSLYGNINASRNSA